MNVTETIVIAAKPDVVRAVGGDVGNIADRIPAIEASHMEGGVRYATFADGGGDARGRIVERDDSTRSYVYEYLTGPLPLQSYRSRFTVGEHDGGSEIARGWSSCGTASRAEPRPARWPAELGRERLGHDASDPGAGTHYWR